MKLFQCLTQTLLLVCFYMGNASALGDHVCTRLTPYQHYSFEDGLNLRYPRAPYQYGMNMRYPANWESWRNRFRLHVPQVKIT